jgi:enoyl-CoA hydratase/carnithine racemase
MSTTTETAVRYERDADGIVTLTLDDPTASANTMNELYQRSMHEAVERLYAERDDITGVVVASAKKTFFAGGNLTTMIRATPDDAATIFAGVEAIKVDLRRLERLGRPVVAAINGAALGGGLEIALACHHRILVDDPAAVVGHLDGLLLSGGEDVDPARSGAAGARVTSPARDAVSKSTDAPSTAAARIARGAGSGAPFVCLRSVAGNTGSSAASDGVDGVPPGIL